MDDIRDIKGPVPLPGGLSVAFWALVPALFAVAGLAVWRFRRVSRPEVRALAAVRAGLDRLASEAAGMTDRDYYYRLADLAGQALSARLGIAATAMTTAELAPRLAALPEAEGQALAALFARADAARYAGRDIAPEARLADAAAVAGLAGRRGPC